MAPGRGAGGQYPQLARLDRFRSEHPGAVVSTSEFGSGWDAGIPLDGDGERFLHRGDLGTLLDDAETIYAGGDPRAGQD